MHNLEKLEIWGKAMDLVTQVYILISNLPKDEQYGLTSQIKRCAISIPSNIAEGAGRNSNKEFIYFLGISQGSSYELKTQLLLTSELKLIAKKEITRIIKDLEEIQKMNFSFQNYLKSNV